MLPVALSSLVARLCVATCDQLELQIGVGSSGRGSGMQLSRGGSLHPQDLRRRLKDKRSHNTTSTTTTTNSRQSSAPSSSVSVAAKPAATVAGTAASSSGTGASSVSNSSASHDEKTNVPADAAVAKDKQATDMPSR